MTWGGQSDLAPASSGNCLWFCHKTGLSTSVLPLNCLVRAARRIGRLDSVTTESKLTLTWLDQLPGQQCSGVLLHGLDRKCFASPDLLALARAVRRVDIQALQGAQLAARLAGDVLFLAPS